VKKIGMTLYKLVNYSIKFVDRGTKLTAPVQ